MRCVCFATACLLVACTLDSAGAGAAGSMTASSDSDRTTGALTTSSSAADDTGSAGGTHAASESDSTTAVDDGSGGLTQGPGTTGPGSSHGSGSSGDSNTGDDATGGGPATPWCDETWPELMACYRFDNLAAGILVDGSQSAIDGTVTVVGIEAGPLGEAATFSDDSQVSVPASAATDFPNQMTMEMFIRIDAIPGSGRVGVLDRNNQYSIFLYADTGLRCGGTYEFLFWDQPTVGPWLHVACVFGDGQSRMYVNGSLVSEAGFGGTIATGDGSPLAIGDNSPTFDEPFIGAIGGLRLWSAPRTQAELCEGAGSLCSN